MNGKKYINKLYLMAAFEPKAKKGKKKGGKGRIFICRHKNIMCLSL